MGIEGGKPFIVEPFYKDPSTIPEMASNMIVQIHNSTELGEISAVEAQERMDKVEEMRIAVGDGWFDRYGPPPPELDHLFVGEDRYWERGAGDR